MAMAKMSVPLWFTRPWGEAAAAGHEAKAAEGMAQGARLMAGEAFEAAWAEAEASREQWKRLQQDILPRSRQARDLGISGFRAGSIGTSDALAAVKAYRDMSLDAVMLTARAGHLDGVLERLTGEQP